MATIRVADPDDAVDPEMVNMVREYLGYEREPEKQRKWVARRREVDMARPKKSKETGMAVATEEKTQKIQVKADQASQTLEKTAWLDTMIADYLAGSAHSFILHGNVFDFATTLGGFNVRRYLAAVLARHFMVIEYAPDEGVTFPGPKSVADETRGRVKQVLMGDQPAAPELTPAQKALQMAAGNPQAGQEEFTLPSSPGGALGALVQFLEENEPIRDENTSRPRAGREGGKACVIVDRFDLIAPPGDKATLSQPDRALLSLLHRVGTNTAIDVRGGLVIFLSPSLEEIHADLRAASAGLRAIEVPLPTYEERLAFSEQMLVKHEVTLDQGVSLTELASQTAGLGRRHIENIALCAVQASGRTISRPLIQERKKILMSQEYADVLEVMQTSIKLEMVGGHTLAKEYLQEWMVTPLMNPDMHDLAPLGVLLAGGSGVGKTMLVRALANHIGWNCVFLRPEKTKGQFVGQSERLLAKALSGIRALAPCLVFIDEIDQGGRRTEASAGDGGSAVEGNAFGRILEFFSQEGNRGRIVLLGATNRPDLIDTALLRRLEFKVPLFPPETDDDRWSVLATLMTTYKMDLQGLLNDGDGVLSRVANETEGWTQAELDQLVIMAQRMTRIKQIPLKDALVQAHSVMRPATQDVQRMTDLAVGVADNIMVVPERYRAFVGQRQVRGSRTNGRQVERAEQEEVMVGRSGKTL